MKIFTFLLIGLLTFQLSAQKITLSSGEVAVSKEAKKAGSYFGGGYNLQTGEHIAILSYPDKKSGTLYDVYKFDSNNKPMDPISGLSVEQLMQHLDFESTEGEASVAEGYNGKNVQMVRANFTGSDVVVESGKLTYETAIKAKVEHAHNIFKSSKGWYVEKLYYDMTNKDKLEVDMLPMAMLVYEGKIPDDVASKLIEGGNTQSTSGGKGLAGTMMEGFKSNLDAQKAQRGVFVEPGGKVVVVGRSRDGFKSGFNNNRLKVVLVDAQEAEANEIGIHEMPYAFQVAASEPFNKSQKLAALIVPFNSPNNYKDASKYQMDKENRNRVTLAVINAKGELENTVEFRSVANDGFYSIFEDEENLLVTAALDQNKNGFYGSNMVNAPTHVQFTKYSGGKVAFNKSFSLDEINASLSSQPDEKIKKIKLGKMAWDGFDKIGAGNYLVQAYDDTYVYAFYVTGSGDLKRTYVTRRVDAKGTLVDITTAKVGGDMALVIRETPSGVVDVQVDVKNTGVTSNGYYTYTTASVTPRNVNEIKAVVKVLPISKDGAVMGDGITAGGKEYLVVGDDSFIQGKDGQLMMIGYDLEGHKALYSLKVKMQ